MKLGEFFIDLVVDAAKGELSVKQLVSSMGQLQVMTVGQIGLLFTLANKIADMTAIATAGAVGLRLYAAATGDSTEKLQGWMGVAHHFDVEADVVQSAFESISSNIFKMQHGLGGQSFIAALAHRLHLDLTKFKDSKPYEVLDAIRESATFKGLGASEKRAVLEMAGIPYQMVLPLTVSEEKFKELYDHASKFSKLDLEKFTELRGTLNDVNMSARKVGDAIALWSAESLLTSLKWVQARLEKISKFIKELTPEEEVGLFDMVWRPTSKQSVERWGEFFKKHPMGPAGFGFGFDSSIPEALAPATPPGLSAAPSAYRTDVKNDVFVDVMVDGRHIPSRQSVKSVTQDQLGASDYYTNQGARR